MPGALGPALTPSADPDSARLHGRADGRLIRAVIIGTLGRVPSSQRGPIETPHGFRASPT
jgi:hypothetical protein